jgi:hypothetical protein
MRLMIHFSFVPRCFDRPNLMLGGDMAPPARLPNKDAVKERRSPACQIMSPDLTVSCVRLRPGLERRPG